MKKFQFSVLLAVGCAGSSVTPGLPAPAPDPVPMTGQPAAPNTTPAGTPDGDAHSHDAHGHDAHGHDAHGHGAHQPPPPPPESPEVIAARTIAAALAAEQSAFEQAKPVFEKHCARCHSEGGRKASKKKLGHFDMTAYPFRGHHAVSIAQEIRRSLGIGGGRARMPIDDKGAVAGAELALISTWADAFDAAQTAGAHAASPAAPHKH